MIELALGILIMRENRAVIYTRVSTADQDNENQGLELRKLAARRKYEIVGEYAETASAWRNGHQSELSRLMTDATKHKFDLVLVWSLDRVSREGVLRILNIIHRLKLYGVRIISYQESWTDAPGELSDLLYALTGWVAETESRRRSERTKAGLARVQATGGRLGRPTGSKDSYRRRRKPRLIGVL